MKEVELLFHPEAAEEYTEAYQWYAERGERLGADFQREIDRALRMIVNAPERWIVFIGECRRLIVRRFPYSVIYARRGSCIWILSIAHNRRRPGYWRHRAEGESL